MDRIGVLILAAGKGTRMGQQVPKQFLEIGGKTLIEYCVEAFYPVADEIVIVTNEEYVSFVEAVARQRFEEGKYDKLIHVAAGGKERYESSLNGLRALRKLGSCDYVLIHDAARCLIDRDTIDRVIGDMKKWGAAVAAVPSVDTVRIADDEGFSESTPDRSRCWCIQTPQGFSVKLIERAYEKLPELLASGISVTDDAMLVEQLPGCRVRLTMGNRENIKVTSPGDLAIAAEKLLSRS